MSLPKSVGNGEESAPEQPGWPATVHSIIRLIALGRHWQPEDGENHAHELRLRAAVRVDVALLQVVVDRVALDLRCTRDLGHALPLGERCRDAGLRGRQAECPTDCRGAHRKPGRDDRHYRRDAGGRARTADDRTAVKHQGWPVRRLAEDRRSAWSAAVVPAERGLEQSLDGFGVFDEVRAQPAASVVEKRRCAVPSRGEELPSAFVRLDDPPATVETDQADEVLIDERADQTAEMAGPPPEF